VRNRGGGSGAGVNQYPRYRTESPGWNSSPLICLGERHFGECLCLGVRQCMSSILETEKETAMT